MKFTVEELVALLDGIVRITDNAHKISEGKFPDANQLNGFEEMKELTTYLADKEGIVIDYKLVNNLFTKLSKELIKVNTGGKLTDLEDLKPNSKYLH